MADSILLVEDNDDEADLTRRAFLHAGLTTPLIHLSDGEEALDYLFGRGLHAHRDTHEQPVVVLLDLKLPRLDGIDVLKAIRSPGPTQCLPVVMLSSSGHDHDVRSAYHHQANSYVRKPVDYLEFVKVVRHLGRYWGVFNERVPRAATRTPWTPA